MKKKLYAAYGSNLNTEQMSSRCPTARIVGQSEIKNYRLIFRGRKDNAVATIEPFKDGKVPVLIWEIMPSDEKSLDIYEGFPIFYRKKNIKVELNKTPIKTMVYIMNEGRPTETPSCYYYSTIRQGYKTAGFDMSFLNEAVELSNKFKSNIPTIL
ncbi:gamma-glutamylcyclotransferase [Clostridia bacterium]|nr:gamma-glutamylcyclotransferase [Clostridia bacterium]GHV24419.1 gamma-glutamylcyclotransferase [Clostridia bacterium]